jgi:DNA-directed RNA polymerase subunit RPC12/RpoP
MEKIIVTTKKYTPVSLSTRFLTFNDSFRRHAKRKHSCFWCGKDFKEGQQLAVVQCKQQTANKIICLDCGNKIKCWLERE